MYRIKILLLLATALANPAAKAQDMIQIPAGPFTMGSNDGRDDERPAHTVTLAAFEIDRLQVTNAEFAMFIDRHGTDPPTASRANLNSGKSVNMGNDGNEEKQLEETLLVANYIELIDDDLREKADSSRCKPSIA